MHELPSYFKEFLSNINPSSSYLEDQRTGHLTLRKRLREDEDFGQYHVNTFLQGSYARDTAIHPGKDVDIVVVTNLDSEKTTVAEVYDYMPKILDRYYKGKWKPQGRSFGISLSYVDLDVVIATSRHHGDQELVTLSKSLVLNEADIDWRDHPLLIPDRDRGQWVETHPKAQLQATTDLNKQANGYFVPLVKIFKWWRKETYTTPERPKGYILERIVAENINVNCDSYPQHIQTLFTNIIKNYHTHAMYGTVPFLPDPGNPKHNVAARVDPNDFKIFYNRVVAAFLTINLACAETNAAKATEYWRQVFGSKFPLSVTKSNDASFPARPVIPNKPAGFA